MAILTADRVVPVSRFNKGEAAKIFSEVKDKGTKYVFKNNMPECVLISPEAYENLVDSLIDMELYIEAMERKSRPGRQIYTSQEAMKLMGITAIDPDNGEVEFE